MTVRVSAWLKFNAVGTLGAIVQLCMLALLKAGLELNYLAAAAIAVEAAVLHNFLWHERWTWRERTIARHSGLAGRIMRFHLTNGFISLCGNMTFMWLFVSKLRLGYFSANILAIAVCSLANFWLSDHCVFRSKPDGTALRSNVVLGSFLMLALPLPALYENSAADKLIRSATEFTYMLHLPEARAAAHELQRKYSDHPSGFLIEAETYWWEAQANPDDKKIEADYYRAQQIAQAKAEGAIQAGKYYKPELLAYLASAYGSYARFQVTQKDAYFSALRAGLRAHDYAQQVYALDSSYYDVYVGLGAFNYFAGTLPAAIKPFAWLLGATGDKNLGVSQLHTAMEKARYSRTEGRIVYYSALLSDNQYAQAFPILEALISDYPDNFVLYDWAAEWFREQNKISEGADYFDRMHEKQLKRSPLLAQYALLERAGLQLDGGSTREAAQTVQRIRSIPNADVLLNRKVEALARRLH